MYTIDWMSLENVCYWNPRGQLVGEQNGQNWSISSLRLNIKMPGLRIKRTALIYTSPWTSQKP